MNFSEKLRVLRKKAGLTQMELAQAIGISQAAITDYERGRRIPTMDKISPMAKALKVSYEELLKTDSKVNDTKNNIVHGNTRTAKIHDVFEKLPVNKQRQVLSHAQSLLKK